MDSLVGFKGGFSKTAPFVFTRFQGALGMDIIRPCPVHDHSSFDYYPTLYLLALKAGEVMEAVSFYTFRPKTAAPCFYYRRGVADKWIFLPRGTGYCVHW